MFPSDVVFEGDPVEVIPEGEKASGFRVIPDFSNGLDGQSASQAYASLKVSYKPSGQSEVREVPVDGDHYYNLGGQVGSLRVVDGEPGYTYRFLLTGDNNAEEVQAATSYAFGLDPGAANAGVSFSLVSVPMNTSESDPVEPAEGNLCPVFQARRVQGFIDAGSDGMGARTFKAAGSMLGWQNLGDGNGWQRFPDIDIPSRAEWEGQRKVVLSSAQVNTPHGYYAWTPFQMEGYDSNGDPDEFDFDLLYGVSR